MMNAASVSQLRASAAANSNNPTMSGAAGASSGGGHHANDNSAEGAALSILSLPPTVSRIEGHRVLAVLQKAIERLKLLTLLDSEQLGKSAAAASATAGGTTTTNPNAASTASAAAGAGGTTNSTTTNLTDSASFGGANASNAATTNANSGIAAILQEQARLEERYDSLVAASKARQGKNPNEPVLDADCFAHIPDHAELKRNQELQEVANSLKSHSKMLCRLLKDNPSDADNWRKVFLERADLIAALETCHKELTLTCQPPGQGGAHGSSSAQQQTGGLPGSYEQFAKKVLEDQAASVWADTLVRKERETNQNVKQLQNEVKAERALKEQEIEARQRTISELKSQLTALRNTVRSQLDQLRSKTEASSEAQQRDALNAQRVLKERIQLLKIKIEDEQSISTSFKAHTTAATERIEKITEEWGKKVNESQSMMQREKADREKAQQKAEDQLRLASDKVAAELLGQNARNEAQQETEEEKQKKETLALARYAAATKVQAAIKGFFTRNVLVSLKKKALKKNRRAAAAAASAANAPAAKPGRR